MSHGDGSTHFQTVSCLLEGIYSFTLGGSEIGATVAQLVAEHVSGVSRERVLGRF